MRKQDKIQLSADQHEQLEALIAKGQPKAQLIRNVTSCLKARPARLTIKSPRLKM